MTTRMVQVNSRGDFTGGDTVGQQAFSSTKIKLSAPVSLATGAAGTLVPFDEVVWDFGGHFSLADSGIRLASIGTSGCVKIVAWLSVAFNATGARGIHLYINGAINSPLIFPAARTTKDSMGTIALILQDFAVDDTIQIYGWQNSGSSLNIDASLSILVFP